MFKNLTHNLANKSFRDKILNALGSFSLTLVVIIYGNLSIIFQFNIETQLIIYSFVVYMCSNWMGLNDLFLTPLRIESYFRKLLLDYLMIFVLVYLISQLSYFSKFSDFFSVPLVTYPLFVLTYTLRKAAYYLEAFLFSFFFHLLTINLIIFELNLNLLFTYLLLPFIYLFFIRSDIFITKSKKYENKLNKLQNKTYIKIFFTSVIFGEIDRYVIAYFIDPKVAVLYITLSSTLGLIPGLSVAAMQSHINRFIHNDELFTFSKTLINLYIISGILSFCWSYFLGFNLLTISLIFFPLAIKFYYVMCTISHYIKMYAANKINYIYKLNFRINILGVLVNVLYLFFPPVLIITSISKVVSSIPLIYLYYKNEN